MKKFAILAVAIMISMVTNGQKIRDNHTFLHVDFAAGNLYTAAVPSILTWGLNELTQSNIFENALEIPFYSGDYGTQKMDIKDYDMLGYTAHDLFKNLHPGIKLGYQTRKMSQTNWGIYAAAEYILNQFKTKLPEMGNFGNNKLQRALFGGSAFIIIGGVDKKYHFMIEAGARFNVALDYRGPLGKGKDDINNGVSSHFAFKVTGSAPIQNFGIYADFNHFDLLKNDMMKLKMWNIGIMWTVTPGQSSNRVNIY